MAPAWFPRLAGSGLLLFGTGLLLRGLRAGAGRLLTLPPAADLRRAVVAGLYILGAVLAIVLLGERIGIQIVVFAILLGGLLAAWRRPLAALMLALALTCAFDAVFRLLLRVPLPSGFLTGVL